MTSHNRAWKETKKAEIEKLAKEYPFIAVVTLKELPANIVSVLRKRLFGDAVIIVAKTRVIQKAFEDSGVDTSKMDKIVNASIGIIFSKKNPFELFSFVKKNKGDASARVGDIALQDIIVQAGDTGIPPGPALTTLKAAGLKVAVQGPTISIVADKVVTKKGEEVNATVADVLGKLNMKPMKVGMKIIGVLDKTENEFYSAEALDVDEEELFDKFVLAYQQALNLSVNAEIYNDVSTELIIIKAEREAKAVQEAVGGTPAKGDDKMEDETKTETTDEVKEETAEETNEQNTVDTSEETVKETEEEKAKKEKALQEKDSEDSKADEAPAENTEDKSEDSEKPVEEKKEGEN